MAAINQVITLGIGPGSSIKYLATFGLGIGAAVIIHPSSDHVAARSWRDRRAWAIWKDKRAKAE